MEKIQRALISVSDKTGVVDFARALAERGVEILSTGGTARALREANIPVVDVAEYTGSPEILDGRLKTLHPKVHGGILGRRSDAKHRDEMQANDIGPIDLVAVNLYPFEATVAKPETTLAEAIEQIDIGGPTMVRSAAKNHADVAIVVDSADYPGLIEEMDGNGGALTDATRFRLAKKAFSATARYDAAISSYLTKLDDEGAALEWPTTLALTFEQQQLLRYGENPHQQAAFYREGGERREPSVVDAQQLQGKALSYNNIMDTDAVLGMVQEFADAPFAAVIVKHANPCGAALSESALADAFAKALACDPTSAFGGIIGCSRPLDAATAEIIAKAFYEVIAAPAFEPAARELLAKKKNLRLLEVPGLGQAATPRGLDLRKVVGGMLAQQRDDSREEVRASKVVTKRGPTEEEWAGLAFAWRIAKHVKSNAIVYAAADRTLGIGAGQMSRVDASKIAALKMSDAFCSSGHVSPFDDAQGRRVTDHVVIASDAFFPFRDGVDAAAEAGATAIVQPGGSVRDEEVIAAADEHGMAMVFTGIRHFRH